MLDVITFDWHGTDFNRLKSNFLFLLESLYIHDKTTWITKHVFKLIEHIYIAFILLKIEKVSILKRRKWIIFWNDLMNCLEIVFFENFSLQRGKETWKKKFKHIM